MKLLTLITTFLVCLSFSGRTQVYVKPRALSWTPNSCNNTIICEAYGLQGQDFVALTDSFDNIVLEASNMDTLTNICYFDYSNYAADELVYFASNGYLHYAITYSRIITEDFNYAISQYLEPSHPDSSDGSFIIQFDSLVTGYDIEIWQDNSYLPPYTIVDGYSLSIDSVRNGYIQFYIQDQSDIHNYAHFYIYTGNPATLAPTDTLETSVSFQHAGNNCSGWINVQPESLTANYYNTWSDGEYNTFTRTDLCPGFYSVYTYATDIGTAQYIGGRADTIVLTSDNQTYIDTNLYSITPQDTSYYLFEDCTFDYTEPIDSITYMEDTLYDQGGLVIVVFDMNIYQDSSYINIQDSLILLNDSIVLLDVVIYCNAFKATFNGQRIMFLRGVDNHYFITPAGTSETILSEDIRIYPNPATDELFVKLPKEDDYLIEVIDYNGRICHSQRFTNVTDDFRVDTSMLNNGVYMIQITGASEIKRLRFLKTKL